MDDQPTLVLGGTGKTGRRVAERLRERGRPVRIGSRDGERRFDWNDDSTWAGVLEGASAAYISYYPDLAAPGAATAVGAFAVQAKASGVGRLVLLSGRGEAEAQAAERAVRSAAPDATIVRASWFAQNFSEDFLLEPILAGDVALPVDGIEEPFVDANDIADVATAALTADGHEGRVYEVTGPRLLSFPAAVGAIAAASGRSLRFTTVPIDVYAAALQQEGLPADVVGLIRYLFTEVLDGRNAHLSDGVAQALGREPRDFRDYAQNAAATGVWNGGAR
jgi:uncharacterized protein YbjT (DUF2867 family)